MSDLWWFAEGVLFMCAVVVVTVFGRSAWDAWRTDREEAAHPPVVHTRWGWCQTCGVKVYDNDLHEIGKVHDDGLDENGGGSFSRAEFCPAHCPGTCRYAHKMRP